MCEKRNSEESESSRLEGLYRKTADPVLRTHLLMIWRISLGDSLGEVAQMVGYSKKWTRQIARRYESEGVGGSAIAATPTQGLRRGRCSMRRAKRSFGRRLWRGLRLTGDVERAEGGALDRAEDRDGEGA
jgi:hypothetical protein